MDTTDTRTERDSMGELKVPAWALWGASTQRALENFPIARRGLPAPLLHAYGHLKAACAEVNVRLELLDDRRARAIVAAADALAAGELDRHLMVDVYQTGSGTSTNMNVNEVLANHANRALGLALGDFRAEGAVHPNDHVNRGQSSNDTFPTAMHVAATVGLRTRLLPALDHLADALAEKAGAWDGVIKTGRTHLMDATPIRLGQVFAGYAAQVRDARRRLDVAAGTLAGTLAIGGTAVGTGLNTPADFGARVAARLSDRLDDAGPFAEAPDHRAAQAARDEAVAAHGALQATAVAMSKIANDIRWLGSGPRTGLGELRLPALQPGSSIMPGKVNPVLCESVMQVACRVTGNQAAVTAGAFGGVGSIFELNVAMPMMAEALLESIDLLANVARLFADKVIVGLEPDREVIARHLDRSLMRVTALAPAIGYDAASKVAKRALAEDRTLRAVVLDEGLLSEDEVDRLLDPAAMTRPDS
ncbi:MAG: class II fumarate hydratase [Myxococcales bacterium]|nr:class II fumarate hydratase [Myxococcales bacterium]